jgi:OFA family oxalate/formate antiporter-like MFS transporter
VGLCFGGFLALYPAVVADFYGTKHYGINYGWMFSAYGAGGIFGPFLAAKLMKAMGTVPYQAKDAAGSIVEKTFTVGNYRPAFLIAGIACLAAAAIVLMLKPPKQPAA